MIRISHVAIFFKNIWAFATALSLATLFASSSSALAFAALAFSSAAFFASASARAFSFASSAAVLRFVEAGSSGAS
eukprot:m.559778 g.559778  ORF g.559778 m.559778 type:complete len:76 (+) comp57779_c0_seq2:143-370(+)